MALLWFIASKWNGHVAPMVTLVTQAGDDYIINDLWLSSINH